MSVFADGVFQYGGMPVGLGSFFPAIRKDAKIYYVDPAIGNDNNSGLRPDEPLDTVTAAYNKTVDKQGDIVFLLGDGSTTGTARDVAIVWANSNTHLIGITAPGLNKRARISTVAASTDVDAYTPYITLSGSGCVFANFSVFQGNSEDSKASVGIYVTGSQNYLYNLDILTGAAANQGDEACYQLHITGSENVVEKCMIGTDTYSRGGTAGANLQLGGARNIIRDCILPMYADANDQFFVLGAASCGDRWHLMERCVLINSSPVLTAATTLAGAVSWSNTAGCLLYMKDCSMYGATDITAADNTKVICHGLPLPTVDNSIAAGTDVAS